VSVRKRPLTKDEFKHAYERAEGPLVPAILSPNQLAGLLGLSVKTIYEWIALGRLDGSFRKRGKRLLIWRDRALDIVFNGKEWEPCRKTPTAPASGTV
jgi:hypothetical protein